VNTVAGFYLPAEFLVAGPTSADPTIIAAVIGGGRGDCGGFDRHLAASSSSVKEDLAR
jgi:hypothetical protein